MDNTCSISFPPSGHYWLARVFAHFCFGHCQHLPPGLARATLHFGKCSQPSIKLTGTPRPCHVGNLIPLHQRLTSRAPPSDTGPTSPIIKPTLVQPTPIVTPCPSVAQFDVIFHTDLVVSTLPPGQVGLKFELPKTQVGQ